MDEQVNEKSEFVVRVVILGPVRKHENADSLSITDVDGSAVVFKSGALSEGDSALYVPIDAVVPTDRKEFSFLKHGTKTTHRIRAIRLRGVFSMGLLVPFSELDIDFETRSTFVSMQGSSGLDFANKMTDWAGLLGIAKYVSPEELRAEGHEAHMSLIREARKERVKMPVYGLDSLRKHRGIFEPGEKVVVTEKIHGCNSRFVYAKGRLYVGSHRAMRGASRSRFSEFLERVTLKLKGIFGMTHQNHKLVQAGDIWWEAAEKYDLRHKLAKRPNMVLYGEIYGENVQDLTYDSPKGRKFRAFDVYDLNKGEFLGHKEFHEFLREIDPECTMFTTPIMVISEYSEELEARLRKYADNGPSMLNSQQVIEGFVIKPYVERKSDKVGGRIAMKYVGEGYLLRSPEQAKVKDGAASTSLVQKLEKKKEEWRAEGKITPEDDQRLDSLLTSLKAKVVEKQAKIYADAIDQMKQQGTAPSGDCNLNEIDPLPKP